MDGPPVVVDFQPGASGLDCEYGAWSDTDQQRSVRPAHDHLLDLCGHRHHRLRRHVLVDDDAPPLNRPERRAFPRKHPRRNPLDHRALPDPGADGDPCHRHPDQDVRLQRVGHRYPDHRLSMEVALQVPGPGRRVLQQPGHPAEQIHNQSAKGEHYLLEVDKPLVLPVDARCAFW